MGGFDDEDAAKKWLKKSGVFFVGKSVSFSRSVSYVSVSLSLGLSLLFLSLSVSLLSLLNFISHFYLPGIRHTGKACFADLKSEDDVQKAVDASDDQHR